MSRYRMIGFVTIQNAGTEPCSRCSVPTGPCIYLWEVTDESGVTFVLLCGNCTNAHTVRALEVQA